MIGNEFNCNDSDRVWLRLFIIRLASSVSHAMESMEQTQVSKAFFLGCLWKRFSVMVCKKLAYPNCSGRVITAPEDL